jgi:hypothetical protein
VVGNQTAKGNEPERMDTEALIKELRWLRWALAVIAGLVGALAVHLIFVQTFLPDLLGQGSFDVSTQKGAIALADSLGGLVFLILAAPTLSVGRQRKQGGGRP